MLSHFDTLKTLPNCCRHSIEGPEICIHNTAETCLNHVTQAVAIGFDESHAEKAQSHPAQCDYIERGGQQAVNAALVRVSCSMPNQRQTCEEHADVLCSRVCCGYNPYLIGNGSKGDGFILDREPFFCFNGLVQTLTPPTGYSTAVDSS